MADIRDLIGKLKSTNPNVRYEACEELRVAPFLPPDALAALRAASEDSSPEVADAARRALALHALPPSPPSPVTPPTASPHAQQPPPVTMPATAAPPPDYAALASKAESAVKGVEEAALRRVAYQAVLERLITEASQSRPASTGSPPQIIVEPAAAQSSPAAEKVPPRHPLPVVVIFGLIAAILAAAPRIPNFLSILQRAAAREVSIGVLRAYENDLGIRFVTNWLIWAVVAGLLIKYVPASYGILALLDALAVALGLLILLQAALG